jgi:GNAT superfamily N-acetyltransferase
MSTTSQHDQRNPILIRTLSPAERAIWEELWTGYLDFYDTKLSQETKSATWARLHDPTEPMHLLAASLAGRVVGIVHYLYHRSCWTVGDYCYLQDLFVAPDARGKGVGAALIRQVETVARAAGASRIYWLTKEDNVSARALYDKLADRSGFIQYRKLF